MNSFEKLLNTIRTSSPDLISEEAAAGMLKEYNDTLGQMTSDAETKGYEAGEAAGFKKGFAEGKEAAEAAAKASFDELVAQLDEEAANKLAAVVDELNRDHAEKLENVYQLLVNQTVPKVEVAAMDEDHAAKLEETVKTIIDNKDVETKEKIQQIVDALNDEHALKMQEVVDKIDEKHAEQLEELVEAIDNDHAKKLEITLEAIDKDHSKKLELACENVRKSCLTSARNALHRAYKATRKEMDNLRNTITEQKKAIANAKRELAEQKEKKYDLFAESIEKYLNYALEQAIPVKTVVSEAKYNASKKALDKITSILKVNSIIQESKDGVFNDYEKRIQSAKDAQNRLAVECAELKSRLKKEEAKTLLESKISKCTPNEAAFLRNYFANAKSTQVIEEQIEDARNAYRRVYEEKRNAIVNKVASESKPSALVNEQKRKNELPNNKEKEVVVESKDVKSVTKPRTPSIENAYIAAYAEVLKKNS